MSLEPMERYQYTLVLRLKVRSSYGTAFQDFFSGVLEKTYVDFVRVRPFGSLGDKGCDGYRSTNGEVFQCYGKLEDGALSAKGIAAKAKDDFLLASTSLKPLIAVTGWRFAHNLVDGVPVELLAAIETLKKENPEHQIGLIGPSLLENLVLDLPSETLVELLGPAATAQDTANLRMEAVRDVVSAVMAAIGVGPVQNNPVLEVPLDKLEFNNLPEHWVQIISDATKNAAHVATYFKGHPEPEAGDNVAAAFAQRYRELKLEDQSPGDIMDALYLQTIGVGIVSAAQQVAAQALLAYLFEACEIFEARPASAAA